VNAGYVRGQGSYLFDADGRGYLDFMSGIGVASVGHANSGLAEAVARQARTLIVCPQSQGNDVRADLLQQLTALAGAPLERVFLSSSGSEANEAAIKWARAATGRSKVVAAKRGFAGRTLGALGSTWEAAYRAPFQPLPNQAQFVTFGDADELEAVMDASVAALLLEPIQGEGGVHLAPPGYLQRARELTRQHGALLLLDEVQCGVARSGTFLAAHGFGVTPDIVTLAKGLGGGVPIGATLMTNEVARSMPRAGHGSTFGGNPLASAAALEVLRQVQRDDLAGNAARMGERLMAGLRAAAGARVRQVRGRGLMVGLELRQRVGPVIARLRQRGLLTVAAGTTVIRFLPPLTVSGEEVDRAVELVAAELAP
jgi:acetylornithine/LysW-gamma-L-lysine aminotransferase